MVGSPSIEGRGAPLSRSGSSAWLAACAPDFDLRAASTTARVELGPRAARTLGGEAERWAQLVGQFNLTGQALDQRFAA